MVLHAGGGGSGANEVFLLVLIFERLSVFFVVVFVFFVLLSFLVHSGTEMRRDERHVFRNRLHALALVAVR